MLVVTGMHRSGTSAISMLLAQLGIDFGPESEMLPADRWNARGYMERWDVFRVNTAIIVGSDRFASLWKTPYERRNFFHTFLMRLVKAVYLTMPSERRLLQRAKHRGRELEIISEKLEGKAVKDPRFCLLIGPWSEHGKIDRILFCYRSPAEVARSLRRREGIPLAVGFRFWSYHVENFFEQVDRLAIPMELVDYGRLFVPDHQLDEARRLFRFANRPFDEDWWRNEVAPSLDARLRHHHSENADLPVSIERRVKDIERRRAQSTFITDI